MNQIRRKTISVSIIFMFIFSVLNTSIIPTIVSAALVRENNYVRNGSFERTEKPNEAPLFTGLAPARDGVWNTNWKNVTLENATIGVVTDEAGAGDNSLKFQSTAANPNTRTNFYCFKEGEAELMPYSIYSSLPAGVKTKLTFKIKTLDLGGTDPNSDADCGFLVNVSVLRNWTTVISKAQQGFIGTTQGETGWIDVSIDYTIPESTQMFEINMYLTKPGTVWIDDIKWFIPVETISINNSSISIDKNVPTKIAAEPLPKEAGEKSLLWTSSDPTIASVDQDGNVTGHKEGDTIITVVSSGAGSAASSDVFVRVKGEFIHSQTLDQPSGWDTEKGSVTGTVSFTNVGNIPIEATVVTAVYKDNKLVNASYTAEKNIFPNNPKSISSTATFTPGAGYTAKVFFRENMKTLKPYEKLVLSDNSLKNITISSEFSTGEVTVKGQVEPGDDKAMVSMQMYNIDKDVSQLTPTNFIEIVNYDNQTVPNSNGEFEFKFICTGQTGKYDIKLGITGKSIDMIPMEFNFVSPDDIKSELADINNPLLDIKDVVGNSKFKSSFGFDFPFQVSSMDSIYARLVAKRPFENPVAVSKTYRTAIIVQAINEATTVADFDKLFLEQKDYLTDATSKNAFIKTYTNILNEGLKQRVKTNLFALRPFKDIEDFADKLSHEIINVALSNLEGWGKVNEILTDNKKFIGINDDIWLKYQSLKDNTPVDKTFLGLTYEQVNSLLKINAIFKQAVDKQLKAEETIRVPSNPGGVGGDNNNTTVSVTGGVPIPPVKEVFDDGKEFFDDLDNVSWAIDGINYLSRFNVISGKSEREFKPNDNITREEFTKLIVVAFDLDDENAEVNFLDTKKEDWFYPFVASAKKAGIISGITEKLFGVNQNITRQDMAVIAFRASKMPAVEIKGLEVSDISDISDYAVEAIATMMQNNIINGVGENQFAPLNLATRAQAAQIVYKLVEFEKGGAQ